jgi:2-polyprenyl-6-methoxyphenol hydroxylase-like FAD-dependent oxidoreductase
MKTYCNALGELAKERGVEVRFDMRLENIEERYNMVIAYFDNGGTLTGDVLVGCDGIHSPTSA